MDIALNITTAPQPIRSKPEKTELKTKPAKKRSTQQTNGFSFNFGVGQQKVKAIVARRRPAVQTKTQTNKTPSEVNKNDTKKEKQTESEPQPQPQKTNSTENTKDNFPPTVSTLNINTENSLTLNVFSKPSTVEKPKPKPKRERRKFGRKFPEKKVLSEQEIKEGLRRFKENPNKRPRVADIFDAEEKRKRKEGEIQANEESSFEKAVQDENAVEYGEVNPNARIANAFRVKRKEDSSVKNVDLFRDNPEAKEVGQRFVKPIMERLFDGTKVETLPLHPHAIKNLGDLLSITELTTVQKKAIPKVLEGKDILVRAQTGSGKTLVYALPIVEKLQAVTPKVTRENGVLAVIIVPTRELAIQTYELLLKLLKPFTWIVPGMLMGGEKRKAEKARLRKGINILVGTPGRLVDHLLHTESFTLNKTQYIVLDEADRLLELGYERDVQQIVEAIAKQRRESIPAPKNSMQGILLSATLTPGVQKLAGLALQDPVYIDNSEEDPRQALNNSNGYSKDAIQTLTMDIDEDDEIEETGILTIPTNLELNFVVTPPKLRLVTLSGLLAKEFGGKSKFKAIVFMSTMEMVNYHHDLLNEQLTQKILDEDDEEVSKEDEDDSKPLLKGLRFFKLQGSMSQTERQGVFKSFRECKCGVLIATDVVGRGIDVPEIDLVVQYSPPQFISDFVHRVGRTARAGRSGRAVIFLTPSETQFIRHLEEKRIRLSQVDMEIYLKALKDLDNEAHTVQEAASNLQHKFQDLVEDDREMHTKACKAFVSWVKFYSSFTKELKPIFNLKKAHMGHFAKSFALRDPPKSFVSKHTAPKAAPPTNRLTYTERDPEKMKKDTRIKHKTRFTTRVTNEVRTARSTEDGAVKSFKSNRLVRMLPNSLALTTSEFDSGLPSLKKKKTKS